jgi:branched-chain amino acid transport system ATP-binding protein
VPKRKRTTRKRPAPKRAAARRKPARPARAAKPKARAGGGGGYARIPDSIRRAAERRSAQEHASRDADRAAARERVDETRALTPEPEALRESPAQASRPAAVTQSRAEPVGATGDMLTLSSELERAPAEVREPPPPADRPARTVTRGTAPRPATEVVIGVDGLYVFYGAVQALKGISFDVHAGETVAIIGSNGAGKTTTLKTVSGVSELLKAVRGRITILGNRVESWTAHQIARLGVAHSPEGRKIFPNQTVRDNLYLGAYTRKDSGIERDIEEQYERFPILGQRRNQPAGLMSGGEQQMLAMARALMARPKVLLFDEPSMGLAPLIVKQVFEIIAQLKAEGKTILLVEQMAFQALGIADRAYVLETGSITLEGTGEDLLADPKVKEAYLGA